MSIADLRSKNPLMNLMKIMKNSSELFEVKVIVFLVVSTSPVTWLTVSSECITYFLGIV
jgi:hypothetical protein